MEINIDEIEKECREFMHRTPSKAEFLALIDKLREAEQELNNCKIKLHDASLLALQWQTEEHQKHLELESLRAKINEPQDGSPSEIEMHRMAFKMIQDYGFSCPEELLAAYKNLEKSQVRLSKEAEEALDKCERM